MTAASQRPLPLQRPTLVVLDVDGTLLTSSLEIDRETRTVIGRCASRGTTFALASGRPLSSLRDIAEDLAGIRFLIGLGGGVFEDLWQRQIRVAAQLPEAFVRELTAQYGASSTASVNLYSAVDWWTSGSRELTQIEVRRSGRVPTLFGNVDHAGWLKALVVAPPHCLPAIGDWLGRFGDIWVVSSYPEYLEIHPVGNTKAAWLPAMVQASGVDSECVVAIGDSDNDIPLLAAAAWSAVVGNATSRARDAADLIFPTNDCRGVALALKMLILEGAD